MWVHSNCSSCVVKIRSTNIRSRICIVVPRSILFDSSKPSRSQPIITNSSRVVRRINRKTVNRCLLFATLSIWCCLRWFNFSTRTIVSFARNSAQFNRLVTCWHFIRCPTHWKIWSKPRQIWRRMLAESNISTRAPWSGVNVKRRAPLHKRSDRMLIQSSWSLCLHRWMACPSRSFLSIGWIWSFVDNFWHFSRSLR